MAGSNCALGHGFRISKTPFPIEALPINETPSDLPGRFLQLHQAGRRGFIGKLHTRLRHPHLCHADRRHLPRRTAPTDGGKCQACHRWSEWLWCWVGSEDVANAHRLLMEKAEPCCRHDVYFLNADDTTCLEPSHELVERFNPALLSLADEVSGHQSLLNCDKLKQAVGWRHETSWRDLR